MQSLRLRLAFDVLDLQLLAAFPQFLHLLVQLVELRLVLLELVLPPLDFEDALVAQFAVLVNLLVRQNQVFLRLLQSLIN